MSETAASYSIDSRATRFAPPEPVMPAQDAAAVLAEPLAPARPPAPTQSPITGPTQSPITAPPVDPEPLARELTIAEPLPVAAPPAPARTGIRGLLGTVGIRLAPGPAEQADRDAAARLARDEAVIRQATWTRAVSVLVANRKGGVGKTPVALLLGGALASVRGGSVCVLEVSDDPGALSFRAEGSPANGLGELIEAVERVSTAGQLAGYTAPQTSFASVIGSVRDRRALSRDDVIAVSGVIDSFYGMRIMDSGNQTSSSAFAGALDTADALVVPVLESGDAVFEAVSMLERLRERGGHHAELAERAIILRLTDGRPVHPQASERIDRVIARAGAAHVFSVPYDAHIAERGELSLGRLAPQTYRVFAAAAASIVSSVRIPVG